MNKKTVGRNMLKNLLRLVGAGSMLLVAACASPERTYTALKEDVFGFKPAPAVIRQPVVPEMLVNCRGHVLVPALGMTLVFKDQAPPERGQFIREERFSAPYRILRPGARVSNELSPRRLNIELDDQNRITGLYCG